jgi:hypothetical protein
MNWTVLVALKISCLGFDEVDTNTPKQVSYPFGPSPQTSAWGLGTSAPAHGRT